MNTTWYHKESCALIPASTLCDQSTIATLREHNPLILNARAFFALLKWSVAEPWEMERSARGRPAYPEAASPRLPDRIREGIRPPTGLRHLLLVIARGFRLVRDPSQPDGCDVAHTLPCDEWLADLRPGRVPGPVARHHS